MLGRGDGDQLGDRVDAVLAADAEDGGEAPAPRKSIQCRSARVGAQVARVEPHVRLPGLDHPAGDGLGHHVAWREVGELVLALHEAPSLEVDEERALAAHRLGDQRLLALGVGAEPHHGRVELDELEVAQPGSGAQRDRHAVAGGDAGVGRLAEHLAEAARREHDRAAVHGTDAVVLALAEHVEGQAGDGAVGRAQQVDGESVLDDLDLGRAVDGGDEGALDLGAGGVAARVGDPVAVVAALAGQRQLAVGVVVELRAERDQLADGVRALGHQYAYGVDVARSRAGHEGVALVLLGGVARPQRSRDAALRPLGGAGGQDVLGDHQQVQRGVGGVDAERGRQPGDAGAHDHDVGAGGPAGRRCAQAAGDRPVWSHPWRLASAVIGRARSPRVSDLSPKVSAGS